MIEHANVEPAYLTHHSPQLYEFYAYSSKAFLPQACPLTFRSIISDGLLIGALVLVVNDWLPSPPGCN
ncbi:MAG: hypothetical protein NVS1B6_14620 [Steroidobacteraceae bacterium]